MQVKIAEEKQITGTLVDDCIAGKAGDVYQTSPDMLADFSVRLDENLVIHPNTAYIALSDTISPIYMSQAMQHAIDAKPGEGYPYLMACVCANDTAEVVTRMADISKAIDQTNLIMGQLLICDALPIGNLAKALQKNFQDVTIDSINGPEGYFAIANNNYFVTLSHYTALWQVWEGDQVKAQGTLTVPSLQPRGRVTVKVPFDKSKMLSRHTYTVRLSFRLKHKLPWAEEGEVMASHDFYIMLK